MFVAVIYFNHDDVGPYNSRRPTTGFEAVLAATKEEAAQKAQILARQWEGVHPPYSDGWTNANAATKEKFYGPYRILIGELDTEAKSPVELEHFDSDDLDF
jgi:hypothetical protein